MSRTLIVFFSRRGQNYAVGDIREGNAEHIAGVIQAYTKAEMHEILPFEPYPLDYKACTEVALEELRAQARPIIKDGKRSLDDYDKIYLCYPNWWGTYPRIVATFLESYDFTGKTIVPICTHEGSGMGYSERELARTLPTATIKRGLAIKGTSAKSSDDMILRWIKKH